MNKEVVKAKQKFIKLLSRITYLKKSDRERVIQVWSRYIDVLAEKPDFILAQLDDLTNSMNDPIYKCTGKMFDIKFGLEQLNKLYEMALIYVDGAWVFHYLVSCEWSQEGAKKILADSDTTRQFNGKGEEIFAAYGVEGSIQ